MLSNIVDDNAVIGNDVSILRDIHWKTKSIDV